MNRRSFFGRTAGAIAAAAIAPTVAKPTTRTAVATLANGSIYVAPDGGEWMYLTPYEAWERGVPWRRDCNDPGLMVPPPPDCLKD